MKHQKHQLQEIAAKKSRVRRLIEKKQLLMNTCLGHKSMSKYKKTTSKTNKFITEKGLIYTLQLPINTL